MDLVVLVTVGYAAVPFTSAARRRVVRVVASSAAIPVVRVPVGLSTGVPDNHRQ